jgi:large subunit ribosomal protein L18
MQRSSFKQERRDKRRIKIRSRVAGTQERPRLAVHKSLKHIYVQAIDDGRGVTLACASSRDKEAVSELSSGGNVGAAKVVGKLIARRMQEKGLDRAVFDRGGHPYHGRVKAVAEAAREAGLKF